MLSLQCISFAVLLIAYLKYNLFVFEYVWIFVCRVTSYVIFLADHTYIVNNMMQYKLNLFFKVGAKETYILLLSVL